MTEFHELALVGVTCMATGSLLTLLTCWAAGAFDHATRIEAYTEGMQHALNAQQAAFEAAEYTEHSPQQGAQ